MSLAQLRPKSQSEVLGRFLTIDSPVSCEDESTNRFIRLGKREYLLAALANEVESIQDLVSAVKQVSPNEDWEPAFLDESIKWLLQHRILLMQQPSATEKEQTPAPNSQFDASTDPSSLQDVNSSHSLPKESVESKPRNSSSADSAPTTTNPLSKGFDPFSFRVPLIDERNIHKLLAYPAS